MVYMMENLDQLLFLLGVAFLVMGHELDAIYQKEWRFFFALTGLNDETAFRIFTAFHVPLFVWILLNLNNPIFQIGFDFFLIGHAAVHWLLRRHPKITFNNRFSQFWIWGGAVLGVFHLFMIGVV